MVQRLVGVMDDDTLDLADTTHWSSSQYGTPPSAGFSFVPDSVRSYHTHAQSKSTIAFLKDSVHEPRLGPSHGRSATNMGDNGKSLPMSRGASLQPPAVLAVGQGRPATADGHGSRHSLVAPSSPMVISAFSNVHSRNGSMDSVHSGIWTPDPSWLSWNPTSGKPSTPLGNGTFRQVSAGEAADSTDYGLSSSLLFGAGNSPWTTTGQESHKVSTVSPRVSSSLSRDGISRQSPSLRPVSRPYK